MYTITELSDRRSYIETEVIAPALTGHRWFSDWMRQVLDSITPVLSPLFGLPPFLALATDEDLRAEMTPLLELYSAACVLGPAWLGIPSPVLPGVSAEGAIDAIQFHVPPEHSLARALAATAQELVNYSRYDGPITGSTWPPPHVPLSVFFVGPDTSVEDAAAHAVRNREPLIATQAETWAGTAAARYCSAFESVLPSPAGWEPPSALDVPVQVLVVVRLACSLVPLAILADDVQAATEAHRGRRR